MVQYTLNQIEIYACENKTRCKNCLYINNNTLFSHKVWLLRQQGHQAKQLFSIVYRLQVYTGWIHVYVSSFIHSYSLGVVHSLSVASGRCSHTSYEHHSGGHYIWGFPCVVYTDLFLTLDINILMDFARPGSILW